MRRQVSRVSDDLDAVAFTRMVMVGGDVEKRRGMRVPDCPTRRDALAIAILGRDIQKPALVCAWVRAVPSTIDAEDTP